MNDTPKSNKPENILDSGMISRGNETLVIRAEFERKLFMALIVDEAKYVHRVRFANRKAT